MIITFKGGPMEGKTLEFKPREGQECIDQEITVRYDEEYLLYEWSHFTPATAACIHGIIYYTFVEETTP